MTTEERRGDARPDVGLDAELRTLRDAHLRLMRSHTAKKVQHDRLLAVLPIPVVVTDEQGGVRSANGAATATLRLPEDRVLSEPLQSFVDVADRDVLRRAVARMSVDGTTVRQALVLRPPGGGAVRVEVIASAARPDDGTTEITWVLFPRVGGDTAHRPSVAKALLELTRLPLHKLDRRRSLETVADICTTALGDVAAISVTLGPPIEPTLVVTTSKLAQDVDGAQMVAQEGPGRTAWEERRSVHVPDLHAVDHWPRFVPRVRAAGLRSVIAVPVVVGETLMGGLNAYSTDAGAFDEDTVEGLELLAGAAGAVLHEMDLKAELEALSQQLAEALESRAAIDQAKGILMVLHGEDADQAFERLVGISSRHNVKVREVATRVIAAAAAGLPVTGLADEDTGAV